MENSINTSNILHHHQNTTEIITPFLKPLYENLGIDSLSYIGFKENRIYVHDTNTPWVELSLERELYSLHYYEEEITQIRNKKSHVIFRNDNNNIITKFAVRHGFGSEISIYKIAKKTIEMWHFRTAEKSSQIINFYLNNLPLFYKYISYIKNEIPFLFDFTNENYLLSETNFSNLLTPNSLIETQDSNLFEYGRTIEEIAGSLNISTKTVETYLLNQSNKISHSY